MSDNDQMFGDGQDNYADGARKAANAAKQFAAAKAGTAAGEAAANSATAAVNASVQGGSAVSEIAVGTSSGGPWGAVLAAAWSLRHTLFKILVCLCLFFLLIVAAIILLPTIVFNSIFHTDPPNVIEGGPTEPSLVYSDASSAVAGCVERGHDAAFAKIERLIAEGNYDYDLSMEALADESLASPEYDICYILAAYSASMQQRGASKADMEAKLDAVAEKMFPVTWEVRQKEVAATPPATGTVIIYYLACTIHPFDQSVVLEAFTIDVDARYDQFNVNYAQAISSMTLALKKTLYIETAEGDVPPIIDTEAEAILATLTCSSTRKEIIRTGLSLVGRVPYFWGGKSPPGWNSEWNTPKLVTVTGSQSTGTIRPYGLDCSGFTKWVYETALGVYLGDGTSGQWANSYEITKSELRPGDLGFMAAGNVLGASNHVLIYVGKDTSGDALWVHCTSGSGVVLSTASYVRYYRRPNVGNLEAPFTPGE